MARGQVENQVKISRGRFFAPRRRVANYDELNDILNAACLDYAKSMRHPEFKDRTVYEVFLEEQASLVPCQGPYNGFHESETGQKSVRWTLFPANGRGLQDLPGELRAQPLQRLGCCCRQARPVARNGNRDHTSAERKDCRGARQGLRS